MRIIAGSLKRRTVHVPAGLSVRPTSDRVREAVFNVLAFRTPPEEAAVLDLFAGSGALGFEALSRGAASVVFVERDARTVAAIRDNAEALGVASRSRIVRADAHAWLLRGPGGPFDLIFADPPYDDPDVDTLPERALPHLAAGGILVVEHRRSASFGVPPGDTRRYGRTAVSFFTSDPAPPAGHEDAPEETT